VLALPVTYSDRTRSLEQYRLGLRMGAQVHGAPPDRRMKECVGAAYPPAPVDVTLEVACTFLACAVIVGIARDAHLGCAIDECFAQRAGPVGIGDGQRSAAPAIAIVARADAALRAHEI